MGLIIPWKGGLRQETKNQDSFGGHPGRRLAKSEICPIGASWKFGSVEGAIETQSDDVRTRQAPKAKNLEGSTVGTGIGSIEFQIDLTKVLLGTMIHGLIGIKHENVVKAAQDRLVYFDDSRA